MASTRHSFSLALTWFIACTSGCGGDAADAVARVTGAQSHCKSPSEVIEKFNQMHENELVDIAGVLSMIHPENQWQADLLSTVRNALPLYELDATMRAEYGVPLERCPMETIFAPAHKAARIVEEEEARATATYVDCNVKTNTLYLTKQGSGWFISGFTLEYSDSVKQGFETGTLLAMNKTFAGIHQMVPTLQSRLKSGEFRSASVAKTAVIDAAQSR
jgi:hypothetical protein